MEPFGDLVVIIYADGKTMCEQNDIEHIIENNRRLIERLCISASAGNTELCADLVCECYLWMWHRRGTLRPDAGSLQVKAWVIWQCKSVFSHRMRSARPRHVSLDTLPEKALASDSGNDHAELLEELAVDLRPRERRMLELLLEGYSTAEIAAMMGISTMAAKTLRHRMIESMRLRHEKNIKQ